MTLGGSVFIRNAIKHDYCLEASIRSLLPICDEVVALDASSDDGTVKLLKELATKEPKLKLVLGEKWECAPNYERLMILANQAISHLKTPWHFMIQADEVLHESSYDAIREIIQTNDERAYIVRRPHIFRNMDYYIRHDIPEHRKPSGDYIVRLGRTHKHFAYGDAQGLASSTGVNWDYKDKIILFHYSYVRKNAINISRVIDIQSWFHGPGSAIDSRILEMRDKDNVFRPEVYYAWEDLKHIELDHPSVVKDWVDERRGDFRDEPK